jgi:polyhydroxybutyrate depolymerase
VIAPGDVARRASALVVAGVLVAGCSSSGPDPEPAKAGTRAPKVTAEAPGDARPSGPSGGCKGHEPVAPGTTDDTITSGGEERSYEMTVPDGYDGTEPYALVFGFHSLTVDYHIVSTMSGFPEQQDDHDFIAVTPSGLISTAPYWNASPAPENYDLDFVADLLDHLEATLCIDTAMVFSVGMSNGAQMSSMLACRLDGRIAAIAPIAGVEYNQPCDAPPTPVIAFHGTADPFVPYEGGGLDSVAIADQNFYKGKVPEGTAEPTGVDESMDRWAKHNGCRSRYDEERISPKVRKRTWPGCDAATVLYIVDGGGHQWPGRPQPAFEATFGPGTTEIDATDLMFTLFFEGEA